MSIASGVITGNTIGLTISDIQFWRSEWPVASLHQKSIAIAAGTEQMQQTSSSRLTAVGDKRSECLQSALGAGGNERPLV